MERFQYLSLWFHDLLKLVITHLNKNHRDRPRDFLGFLEGNLLWDVGQSAFNSTHHGLKSMLTSNLHQWCPLCFDRLMAQLLQVLQRSNLSGPLEIYCVCRRLSPPWAGRKSETFKWMWLPSRQFIFQLQLSFCKNNVKWWHWLSVPFPQGV